jgi:hypothetical protein
MRWREYNTDKCVQYYDLIIEGKSPLGSFIGVDRMVILNCALQRQGGMVWTGFIWLRVGYTCKDLCERGTEHSSSKLVKKVSALWS